MRSLPVPEFLDYRYSIRKLSQLSFRLLLFEKCDWVSVSMAASEMMLLKKRWQIGINVQQATMWAAVADREPQVQDPYCPPFHLSYKMGIY
jgi:hypothetical protein